MSESFEFLTMVIDANPIWWGRLMEERNDDKGILLKKVIPCLISFCQAFKFLRSLNHLLVIAASSAESSTIYCDATNSRETLKELIENGLATHFTRSPELCNKETKIAGPLATALCYANRLKKECPPGQTLTSRLLVLKVSDDSCSQYMNLMNIFFTAQKQNVLIDSCVLGRDSALLQQASDITGGVYVKVENFNATLQYLMNSFLPDTIQRSKMITQCSGDVDYRPACFCHQRLISVGWVCSVCLSVFCQFSPICSTCQSVFKFLPTLPKVVKKRKK